VQPLLPWKSNNITQPVFVIVALFTQHAMRARHIVICGFPRYFSTRSRKRHDFRKIVTEHKMCVLIFSTYLSHSFFILRRNERDIIKNVYRYLRKALIIALRF
jgi:hypothetical protein